EMRARPKGAPRFPVGYRRTLPPSLSAGGDVQPRRPATSQRGVSAGQVPGRPVWDRTLSASSVSVSSFSPRLRRCYRGILEFSKRIVWVGLRSAVKVTLDSVERSCYANDEIRLLAKLAIEPGLLCSDCRGARVLFALQLGQSLAQTAGLLLV